MLEEPAAAPEEPQAPGAQQGTARPQFPSLYPNGAAVDFEDWRSVGSQRKRTERGHELNGSGVPKRAGVRDSLLNGVTELDQPVRVRAEPGGDFVACDPGTTLNRWYPNRAAAYQRGLSVRRTSTYPMCCVKLGIAW